MALQGLRPEYIITCEVTIPIVDIQDSLGALQQESQTSQQDPRQPFLRKWHFVWDFKDAKALARARLVGASQSNGKSRAKAQETESSAES